jgi:hypothetical protein
VGSRLLYVRLPAASLAYVGRAIPLPPVIVVCVVVLTLAAGGWLGAVEVLVSCGGWRWICGAVAPSI